MDYNILNNYEINSINDFFKNNKNNILAIRSIFRLIENKLNQKINDKIEEPTEISISKEDQEKIFPQNNYKNYKFTNISLYSITPYDQSIYTLQIINSFFKELNTLIITEANGCIGGNTWIFAKKCKYVNVIELNKIHYEILKYNMSLLKFKNINFIKGNCIDYIYDLKQDIIFFDPPWGGVNYKKKIIKLVIHIKVYFFQLIILYVKNILLKYVN